MGTQETGTPNLKDFLAKYPPAVCFLILATRRALCLLVPDAIEMLDFSAHIIGYGFGTRYADMVCAIIPSKTGVKLGIANAADLPDSHRLLRGSGKRHRHVPLKSADDLEMPALKSLLVAAAAAARQSQKGVSSSGSRRARR
jgi:hypothetical protein